MWRCRCIRASCSNNRLPSVAQHVRGSGNNAEWRRGDEADDYVQPQFLLGAREYRSQPKSLTCGTKIAIRSLARATDVRTIIAGVISDLPGGISVNYLTPGRSALPSLSFSVLSSQVFDWQARTRIAGSNINYHFLEEMALPAIEGAPGRVGTPVLRAPPVDGRDPAASCSDLLKQDGRPALAALRRTPLNSLGLSLTAQAVTQVEWGAATLALTPGQRRRLNALADALIAAAYGLNREDLAVILEDCDHPDPHGKFSGFWRVDKGIHPELRHTVLTQIAFAGIQRQIDAVGRRPRSRHQSLHEPKLSAKRWLLPEPLRVSDYGLGHDDRAKEHQPVASELGARFHDWQLGACATGLSGVFRSGPT